MEVRELREKAGQLFAKGKFVKAAETYEEYCAVEEKDHQARVRGGDAWAKAGKKDKAILSYSMAAEGFAKDGFLPRAIAASKLVLEIDPGHTGVRKMLANLYAQKSGGAGAARFGAFGARAASVSAVTAAPAEMEISRSIEAPMNSNFSHRSDALELPDYEITVGTAEHLPAELQLPQAPVAPVTSRSPSFEPIVNVSQSAVGAAPSGVYELTEALPDSASPSAVRPAPSGVFELTEVLPDSASPSAVRPAPSGVYDLTESAVFEPERDEPIEALDEADVGLGELPKIPLFSDLPEDALSLCLKCPLQHFESDNWFSSRAPRRTRSTSSARGGSAYSRRLAARGRTLPRLRKAIFWRDGLLSGAAQRVRGGRIR